MDLGVMAVKGYSTFPKAPGLESHHQMKFSVRFRTLVKWGGGLALWGDARYVPYIAVLSNVRTLYCCVKQGGIKYNFLSLWQDSTWYWGLPCLTLSILTYRSRVKWRNPGEGVAPSSTPRCSSYWKGNLRVALDYSRQLYLIACVLWHMRVI